VGEVGGRGGRHQRHLHLCLKKGQYQQQNFINQNTLYQTKTMIDFLLLLINSFAGFIKQVADSDNNSIYFFQVAGE
jgi:hypothetical protein